MALPAHRHAGDAGRHRHGAGDDRQQLRQQVRGGAAVPGHGHRQGAADAAGAGAAAGHSRGGSGGLRGAVRTGGARLFGHRVGLRARPQRQAAVPQRGPTRAAWRCQRPAGSRSTRPAHGGRGAPRTGRRRLRRRARAQPAGRTGRQRGGGRRRRPGEAGTAQQPAVGAGAGRRGADRQHRAAERDPGDLRDPAPGQAERDDRETARGSGPPGPPHRAVVTG